MVCECVVWDSPLSSLVQEPGAQQTDWQWDSLQPSVSAWKTD